MSILAGVISWNRTPIPAELVSALRSSLSRNPAHRPIEHRAPGVYLCKIDLGAYGSPAFRLGPSGCVSMLAGHPLLAGVTGSRNAHLDVLHEALDRDDWTVLERARGTYCAAHYSASDRILSLIGDKLGVRPIYYWVGRDFAFFASSLRILEALTPVPKVMDLRGVGELVAFGHTLGRRTPYADVRVLHSGEVVRIGAHSVNVRRYWAWDEIVAAHERTPQSPRQIYDLFSRAVSDRLEGDRATLAFLSGGLDSRCIVSALRGFGVRVHSFNFFRSPDSPDAIFASQIATALGCEHEAVLRAQQGLDFIQMMTRTLAARTGGNAAIERPKLAWSGDGGSVGPGLVYVDEDIVRVMRDSKERDAIQTLLGRHGSRPDGGLYTRKTGRVLRDLPVEGALAEFAALRAVEPGRRFHLFLMVNNQRRHLAEHFENIDLSELELHLPFFDADFLGAVFTVPFDESLRHTLYHRWLDQFPPVTLSVPWQAYPGHVPCPLPIPPGLVGQWDPQAISWYLRALKREHLDSMWQVLISRDFPHPFLRRSRLLGYLVAYGLGVADCSWVAGIAETFHRYWTRSLAYVISPLRAD